jgi:hypothetical protein
MVNVLNYPWAIRSSAIHQHRSAGLPSKEDPPQNRGRTAVLRQRCSGSSTMPMVVTMVPMMMVVPVVMVVMTVPVPSRNDDHSAARATIGPPPVGWDMVPPTGNAVHTVNHCEIFNRARDAGRGTDPGRVGTLGQRA